jgi:hypothetical protein
LVGGDGLKLRLEEDCAEEPGCWLMTLPSSELLLELSLALKAAFDRRRRLRLMWSLRKDGIAAAAICAGARLVATVMVLRREERRGGWIVDGAVATTDADDGGRRR